MKKPLLLFSIFLLLSAVMVVDSASLAATRNLIYIRSDGSVEPSTAPIQRVENVYTFTDDIQGSIIVETNNVVIDGAGFTLQGTGANDVGSDNDQNRETYGPSAQEVDKTIIPESNNTGIYSYAQKLTIMNLKISEFWCAIELEYSSDNYIFGNEITNNNQGIWIHFSSNNTILDNSVTNNGKGISLTASYNTVSGNRIADNREYGIQFAWSFNNVSENLITNNYRGIHLDSSCHNTFRNNVFSDNTYGLYVSGSSSDFFQDIDDSNSLDGKPIYYWVNRNDLTVPSDAGCVALINCTRVSVQDLNLTKKWQAAVLLVSTAESTITRNSIKNSDQGICLIDSVNNSISGNMITNSVDGIAVKDSSNYNVISENTLTDNDQGIYLFESSNSTLRRNSLIGNGKPLVVYCYDSVYSHALSRFIHDVDTSNTVDGKPIYYWINEQDKTVPSDAGQVVLVNCTNMKAEKLNLVDGSGVQLAWTTNSSITKNIINGYGISLYHSSNNIVSENNPCGIDLYFSSNNNIHKNNATNNSRGISLSGSSHNNITENSIINNQDGIYLESIWTIGGVSDPDPNAVFNEYRTYESSHNIISGNNITNNSMQGIRVSSSNNTINDNNLTKNGNGISLSGGSNNTVIGNSITDNNKWGITVYSLNNTVSKNYLSNNGDGIHIGSASNNTISGNKISNSTTGINLQESSDNYLVGNTITNNTCGINLTRQPEQFIHIMPFIGDIVRPGSLRNNVSWNLISDCTVGVQLDHSSDNIFVHNSFIDNPTQIINYNSTFANTWDNGTEGNHWSNYTGTDSDGDGVGDTPYVIDENNQDNYPLMNPYETSEDSNDTKPATSDIILVTIAVIIGLVIVVGVAFYRRNRKA